MDGSDKNIRGGIEGQLALSCMRTVLLLGICLCAGRVSASHLAYQALCHTGGGCLPGGLHRESTGLSDHGSGAARGRRRDT